MPTVLSPPPSGNGNGNGHATDAAAAKQSIDCLHTLYLPGDVVLFRPVETWTAGDKKHARTVYRETEHHTFGVVAADGGRQHAPALDRLLIGRLHSVGERENANIFFGVCPRFGGGGKYDKAWQIRTVRVLWCDIDHAAPDAVLARVEAAGLPSPTIVVSSGHGSHFYWLLAEPYLIDDCPPPPPVETEWSKETNPKTGKKSKREYIVGSAGERIYLTPSTTPELSPKAQHVQDMLAGIAAAIGGDHTFDLSRLLRLPGTLNRKNARNGATPKPCEIVTLDRSLAYPLADFERLAEKSPSRVRRETVAKITLPESRPIKTKKATGELAELVNVCKSAAVGSRSDADFALCCVSVERGWDRDDVWRAVADVGKFAECGEVYFDRTWKKAKLRTQEKIHDEAAAKAEELATAGGSDDGDGDQGGGGMIHAVATLICAEHQFARDAGGKLHVYRNGVYRPDGEAALRRLVKTTCHAMGIEAVAKWNRALVADVTAYIAADCPELWDRPPLDRLNVANGILDLTDPTKPVLLPHSPDWLSTIQLPVPFDPAATCPAIDEFVGQVFPADAIELAFEIAALLIVPNTAIQKAILLLGPGGNGKSVFLRLLLALLGKANCSGLSLHRLEADKFAAARLYGKLANVCADLPSEHLDGTAMFKAVTGGDRIAGEYKFRDSFEFEPFARLVFSANSPPRSPDSSPGFFDRWLVIPFDRSFRGTAAEVPGDVLDARLHDPRELSGLLNRAIAALPRIRGKCGFTASASTSKAWEEFHATTDPLAVWLDRFTIDDPAAVVPKKTLRVAFNAELERQGKPAATETAFGLAFAKLRPSVTTRRRTVGGRQEYVYIGIGLLHGGDSDAEVARVATLHLLNREKPEVFDEGEKRESITRTSGTTLATLASVATPPPKCDHANPQTWLHRDGKAFCRGCNKFMGRLRQGIGSS